MLAECLEITRLVLCWYELLMVKSYALVGGWSNVEWGICWDNVDSCWLRPKARIMYMVGWVWEEYWVGTMLRGCCYDQNFSICFWYKIQWTTLVIVCKGCPQNFWGFWLPPPCPHLVMIYRTKSTQPPLLCLLLGYPPPPPDADFLYVWSRGGEDHQSLILISKIFAIDLDLSCYLDR